MNSFKRLFVILLVIFFTSVNITYADISTGLIGHYTFDTTDLTTNVHDSSGQGNHGFIIDGMATSTIVGPVGQAMVFNGVGYVELTNSVSDFDFERTEPFTFSVWHRSTLDNEAYSLFSNNDMLGTFEGYHFSDWGNFDSCPMLFGTDIFIFSMLALPNNYSFCPNTSANHETNWNHYVITFTGVPDPSVAISAGALQEEFKIYRNGILVSDTEGGGFDEDVLMQSAAPLQIGGDIGGNFTRLNGYVDDFRIYNRSLSASDALDLYRLGYNASVSTSAASLVSTSTVTLNGSIVTQSNLASSTSRGFVYGTSSGIYTSTSSDTGTYGTGLFSKNLSGLSQNTTYFFKAFALNATSTNYGSELTFTTSSDVDPPTVSQLFASAVSYTTATLNSQITATGGSDATEYGFAYGTSANLSSVIATSTLGSFSGTGLLEEAISGLSVSTTYYFRSYATNSGGTSYSTIESFITRSYAAPTTIPLDASLVAITTATLNGQIQDTNGSSATVRGFVYGTTQSFGATTTEEGTFSAGVYNSAVTGLSANTTYYYKAYATNGSGTSYSTDIETFTTLASTATSVVETDGLASLGTTTVTIYGNIVSTGGSDTVTHGFAYGTSPTLSSVIATSSLGTYSGTGTFSSDITSLTANTTYYYRAYVTNSLGISFGEIKTFVTVDNNGATVSFDIPGSGMQNYTLQLDVTVDSGDPSITIEWPLESGVTSYTIYRKATTDTNWGTAIASVLYGARRFVDMNVDLGTKYEYKVIKNITGGTYAYGYIYSGVEVPLVDDRGKVILVIDDATVTAMPDEVDQLVLDLSGDGWTVIYEEVDNSTATVSSVKTIIEGHYDSDPTNVKAIFLVGAIPVPYSGNINPDGHSDHQGAWPADVYYGEMNATWTDSTVNNTAASGSINDNIPGDGKFDQSLTSNTANSNIEIAVGRLDLRSMGSFGTANALHEQYLSRNHNYRIGNYSVVESAFLSDNFGVFGGEAFAASGWRSFAPLIGGNNIVVSTSSADFLNNIRTIHYKWVYGAGGAGYTGASGVANSSDYAAAPTYGVFNMLFGSYFGDWNNTDNFLRAPLASVGGALTSVWSGRPHWYFHPAGMGDPMSASILASQNNQVGNNILYSGNRAGGGASYMSFLGDPTLRTDIVAPATNLSVATTSATVVTLDWDASADTVLGYNIYSAHTVYGPYTKLNSSLITDTTATTTFNAYNAQYQVRAVLLQTTPSGSYYNNSQGDHQALTVYATPVLGVITDTSGAINTDSDPIALTVSDNATALADLDFTVTSSNQSLVDDANISLGIVSGIQYITITPETDATGSTTITVSVSDGSNTAVRTFVYTVDDIADTTAPSIPGSVSASALSTSEIRLTWSASTDTGTDGGTASGLAGYTVYKNGTFFATTTSTTYDFSGLASGTTYTFYVKSFDENVNISGQSSEVSRATDSDPVASSSPSSTPSTSSGSRSNTFRSVFKAVASVLDFKSEPTVTPSVSPKSTPSVTDITESTNTEVLTTAKSVDNIKTLQVFLNSAGYTVAQSGPGSVGKETDTIGEATKKALREFLMNQTLQILKLMGLI